MHRFRLKASTVLITLPNTYSHEGDKIIYKPTWIAYETTHLNCLEHARQTNSPLFLSSWDIRRALSMDTSWRRLGVPADTARWMVHLDD